MYDFKSLYKQRLQTMEEEKCKIKLEALKIYIEKYLKIGNKVKTRYRSEEEIINNVPVEYRVCTIEDVIYPACSNTTILVKLKEFEDYISSSWIHCI